MIQNNLDPEVAEKPDELIVYGGTGRAARSWDAFDRILTTLKRLKNTNPAGPSGNQVGVFRTHEWRRASHRQLAARSAVGDLGRVPKL